MISKWNRSELNWWTRWCRSQVLRRMNSLQCGSLDLCEAGEQLRLGNASSAALESTWEPLAPSIEVLNPSFYRRVVTGGDVGAAESWMAGEWTSPDLTAVVRHFIRNMDLIDRLDRGPARFKHWASRLLHLRRRNTESGARRNIGAHYDLGNEFYKTFLDPTLAYSAGVFSDSQTSMEEASIAKFDRICRKLELGPSDHVVEIGTGWGGWAIHAAKNFGCRVTTTTISREQYKYACARVEEAGLSDLITVRDVDYRRLEGKYDKLVSIEMIEAVGHRYLDEYFATCRRLLRNDGVACLQAILIRDQRLAIHLRSSDFIRQYIFPGGDLPSIGSILDSTTRKTDFRLVHFEEMSEHYAETLRRWRDAFAEAYEEVRALGFDDVFVRMWHYYLGYCEAAFLERQVNSVQLVLGCGGYRGEVQIEPLRMNLRGGLAASEPLKEKRRERLMAGVVG